MVAMGIFPCNGKFPWKNRESNPSQKLSPPSHEAHLVKIKLIECFVFKNSGLLLQPWRLSNAYISEHNLQRRKLLLLLLLVKVLSPLWRVFIHIFLRQTMSLSNTMSQLFCRYCSRVGSNVLLHQHFPKYVRSAQYGSFL
jgi:hypothetical protein